MLDPKAIVPSLPTLAGELPAGVFYFSSYFRIQKGPVNLSLYSSLMFSIRFQVHRTHFPIFCLICILQLFFFNSLTLLFYSVK